MLRRCLFVLSLFLSLTACSQTYYIVRHAEKASVNGNTNMNATDPPLTDAGKERADALKELLKDEKIGHIFSTNTIRTRTTAEPLSKYLNVPIETYGPRPDAAFIEKLKSLKKNVVIVGHSNTIDDLVNMLCGEQKVPADIDESIYNNLFVVTIKNGKAEFEGRKY
jgi:broad specificity phosphatase PhoE